MLSHVLFSSDHDSLRWAFVSPIGRVTDYSGLPRMAGGGGVLGWGTFGANTKNDVHVLQSRKLRPREDDIPQVTPRQ